MPSSAVRSVLAAALAAAGWIPIFGSPIRAQKPAVDAPSARIKIDIDRTIGTVDPLLFGNFSEHLGRMIYGGIYDEKSPLSDAEPSVWAHRLK